MAIPLTGSPQAAIQNTPQEVRTPKKVLAVKEVSLALVTYVDGENVTQTQLAVIGDNNVYLLNGKQMGMSQTTTQGQAADWLKSGIFEKLGRK